MSTLKKIIVQKIGVTEDQTNWCISLSKKHAKWIAKQIKKNPKLYPRSKANFQNIISWKQKDKFYNINKLDFYSALNIAKEYFDNKSGFEIIPSSLKNKKVYLDLGEYKWVELLTNADCREEGEEMRHCLISKTKSSVYSLRDINNKPKITIRITPTGRISEISGFGNSIPDKIYAKQIALFLEKNKEWKKICSLNHDPERIDGMIDIVRDFCRSQNKKKLLKRINSAFSSNYFEEKFSRYANKLSRKALYIG